MVVELVGPGILRLRLWQGPDVLIAPILQPGARCSTGWITFALSAGVSPTRSAITAGLLKKLK
jgi:hypothetical protein